MGHTIRIQDETYKLLQQLKEYGNYPSFDRCIRAAVRDVLWTTHFFTGTEFHPEGTVLEDPQGRLVVVHKALGGRVLFDDGTSLLNGSYRARGYVKVADSVEECDRPVVQQKPNLGADRAIAGSSGDSIHFDGLGDVGE